MLFFSLLFILTTSTTLAALPDPDPASIQTQTLHPTPPATIPAFLEQSAAAGCPLDLPDDLFHGIKSACGSKPHHRPDPNMHADQFEANASVCYLHHFVEFVHQPTISENGKRLRSMVEIQKYLNDHPEYIQQGVTMSQFCFQIPRPLHDNYVRKRPRPAPLNDASDNNGTPGYLSASEAVRRLEWVRPDVDTELQLSWPGLSADHFEANGSNSEMQSAKKEKTLSPIPRTN